jgi:hypothetical protein
MTAISRSPAYGAVAIDFQSIGTIKQHSRRFVSAYGEDRSRIAGCIDATLGLTGQAGWAHSRQLSVPRIANSLAQVLRPILCPAREAIIVDAYFNPSVPLARSKWLKPLRALAAQLTTDGRVTRFEVHALSSRNDPWDTALFEQHCRNNLSPLLRNGVALDAMLWEERAGGLQFHERLIVTDVGGVSIDPGVDEGNPGQTYDLRLLSKQEVSEKLKKFTQTAGPYDLVGHQRVIGTRNTVAGEVTTGSARGPS